ncbi:MULTISPECIES: hypothetical protein [Niastella]|uniref:Uncharacterized protein n=1 Tax=Niastella soli TaxID=2821487 RepID=A0ABS3YSG3_9BACT|nr:hypothetical protein [Niastella soli]MBO9200784.1 hypothetical protein [Niastella soli]
MREKLMQADPATYTSKWAFSVRNPARLYAAIADTIQSMPDRITYQEKSNAMYYRIYTVYPNDNARKKEYVNSCGVLAWYLLFATGLKRQN